MPKFFRPPLPPKRRNLTFRRKNDIATNTTKTSEDHLIGELERVIGKEKPKENLAPDKDIVFTLPKLPRIFDNDNFEQKQETKNSKIKK